jgi:hypothetical protein
MIGSGGGVRIEVSLMIGSGGVWHTYMKLVTKYQISAIKSY